MKNSIIYLLICCYATCCGAIDIYAHRTAAGLAPENTLLGIQKSLDLQVETIDIDVVMTQDNVIILHHDYRPNHRLTRNENKQWISRTLPPFKDMTFDQTQQLDIGRLHPNYPYPSEEFLITQQDNIRIPSLEEAIQFIQKNSSYPVKLQIEIKTDPYKINDSALPEEITSEVIHVIKKYHMEPFVEVHSFDWRNLLYLQEHAPEIVSSYITCYSDKDCNYYQKNITNHLWTAGHHQFHLKTPELIKKLGGSIWCPYYKEITAEDITDAHTHNVKVIVWTIDTPADMQHMINLGVDGIITNRPDLLKSILN